MSQAVEAVARLTYKPGWNFTWAGASTDLIVGASFPSSRTPGKYTRVNRRITDAWWMTGEQVICAVLQEIKWLEAHEFAEFFKIDGKHVFPPHDGTATVFPPEVFKA